MGRRGRGEGEAGRGWAAQQTCYGYLDVHLLCKLIIRCLLFQKARKNQLYEFHPAIFALPGDP